MKAYAKINLGLDVLNKRADGYHDVCMIMQTVDVYDTLTIRKADHNKISLKTNHPYLPCDKNNIVYKAAEVFLHKYHPGNGVILKLTKTIPVAAGLAGGSSDAAAALLGLNELFQTGLSKEELMKLGVTLGADVPYCILQGTALSQGIGEVLTPLKPMPDCSILLVKPDISVSTKFVYENLNLHAELYHPNIGAMREALEEGNLIKLTGQMDNILQTVTVKNYPVIEEIKDKIREFGALTALMSGSGPTVFGVFDDPDLASAAYKHFIKTEYKYQVFLTKPYWPEQLNH
jgi:4-diphosphocytidyl-2-C-methyl-D-erythritol kinase